MFSRRHRTGRTALRLSDAERERVLEALRVNYAEGRLSTDELEARVEGVYGSATHAQAAVHLRDMPLRGLLAFLALGLRRVQRALLRMHVLTFVAVNASLVCIWALTGQGSFWPALLLVPSAAVLAWHIAASRALTRALGRRHW
jgi:hypothetical protein